MSRLTEKLLVNKWIKPIISHSNYNDQFGFKNTGSTTCALIKIIDDIVSSLDKQNCHQVKALLLDFSKAFDVVDHSIVLRKINILNIPQYIKNWINSFLTDRSQRVKINGVTSSDEAVNRGIVQGSALGPFLFIVMISDFKTLSTMNSLAKYADDSTLTVRSDSTVQIRDEYNNSKCWSVDNKLIINDLKTKLMFFCRNLHDDSLTSPIPGIELVHEATLLGVTIDDKLSFSKHVSNILSTCSQRFYLLKLLRDQGASISVLNAVYQSIVVGRVVYCISAWGGFLKEADIQRINAMFRRAKRYQFTDTLFDFSGLLKYHDNKLFNNMQQPIHCLSHILPLFKPSRPTRNNSLGHPYVLPKVRTELYKKSFIPRVLFDFTYYYCSSQ
jgi:hypothetical protein